MDRQDDAEGRGDTTKSSHAGKPTVVVVGGGYGGFAVAKALDETSHVVLVEPKDAFMHNIAALRALVDPSWLPRIFLPNWALLTNGRVVRDRAVVVDPHRVVTASGEEISADYVVLATGSRWGSSDCGSALDWRHRRPLTEPVSNGGAGGLAPASPLPTPSCATQVATERSISITSAETLVVVAELGRAEHEAGREVPTRYLGAATKRPDLDRERAILMLCHMVTSPSH